MKKVSVIIPIYNSENFLTNCIESILNQTYKCLEIILLDDGSQDNSLEICKQYKNKDDRIVLVSKKNSGVSNTRNVGLDKATGEYIMFVDSDDYIAENYIYSMVKELEDNNVDLAISGLTYCNEKKEIIKIEKYADQKKVLKFDEIKYDLINTNSFNSACKTLYKRKIINDKKFSEDIKYGEDLLFSYNALKNNSAIYVPICGYYYYQNSVSSTHKTDSNSIKKYIEDNKNVYIKFINDYDEKYIIYNRIFSKINIGYKKLLNNSVRFKEFKKLVSETLNIDIKKISIMKIKYLSLKDKILLGLLKYRFIWIYYIVNKLFNMIKKK